ncbi:MAG TPA: glyoxalase superfamily protein, partial [Longimicrobiaceae bacterium]|nr:glyoxalase superfamily protein [Longimicrobiaceae bacterium]
GALLHLSSHADDGVPGSAVYFAVDDVDALHRELLARNVPIALHPFDQTWGMREMYVRDPDGNAPRFGTPAAG